MVAQAQAFRVFHCVTSFRLARFCLPLECDRDRFERDGGCPNRVVILLYTGIAKTRSTALTGAALCGKWAVDNFTIA